MESPCTGVCELIMGVCVGCGRTAPQILRWSELTDEERDEITNKISECPDCGSPRPSETRTCQFCNGYGHG